FSVVAAPFQRRSFGGGLPIVAPLRPTGAPFQHLFEWPRNTCARPRPYCGPVPVAYGHFLPRFLTAPTPRASSRPFGAFPQPRCAALRWRCAVARRPCGRSLPCSPAPSSDEARHDCLRQWERAGRFCHLLPFASSFFWSVLSALKPSVYRGSVRKAARRFSQAPPHSESFAINSPEEIGENPYSRIGEYHLPGGDRVGEKT